MVLSDQQESLTRLPYDFYNLPWAHDESENLFETHNYVGHHLLKGMNIEFNFKRNKLRLFPLGKTPLFSFPYRLTNFFSSLSFEYIDSFGIMCSAETDFGAKRFIIDTGSSITFMKPDHKFQSP
jgi:hypothetical protein